MFPLMRLPNELIFRVVNLVHPADIESLVLCNKSINRSAQEALARHLELKKKYSVIRPRIFEELTGSDLEVRNDERSLVRVDDVDTNTCAFMAEIIQKGDVVHYPVDLHLPSDSFLHLKDEQILISAETEDYYSQDQVASRKYFLIIRDYLRNMPLLSKEDKAEWSLTLHTSCNKVVCVALLFTLLPNIQSVTLGAGMYTAELDYIKRIVENIADSNRSSNIGPKRSRKYLSKLQTVTYNFTAAVVNSLEAILPFAMLPSVQILKGRRIQQTPLEEGRFIPLKWPSTFPACQSMVTEINFTTSAIGAQHFRSLLAGIAALQRFTYYYWHEQNSADFQPRGIVQALEEFAAKSLVSLDLTAFRYEPMLENEQYLKTLRKFIALKSLRVDDQVFEKEGAFACVGVYSEGPREPRKEIEHTMEVGTLRDWMVDMLPSHLEEFTMINWATNGFPYKAAWQLFRDHANLKNELLPDLEHLTID